MLEGRNQAICQGTICTNYSSKAVLIHLLSLLKQSLIKCDDDDDDGEINLFS